MSARKNGRSRLVAEPPAAIRIARRFGAPAARVFDAWLDPEVAGRWLFATASHPAARVEIDARVAGAFRFAEQRNGETIEHSGKYIEIVPHRRLVFTLAAADQPRVVTRVTVEITPLGTGCALRLTHERVPPASAHRIETRWTGNLYGLGVTLPSRAGAGMAFRKEG